MRGRAKTTTLNPKARKHPEPQAPKHGVRLAKVPAIIGRRGTNTKSIYEETGCKVCCPQHAERLDSSGFRGLGSGEVALVCDRGCLESLPLQVLDWQRTCMLTIVFVFAIVSVILITVFISILIVIMTIIAVPIVNMMTLRSVCFSLTNLLAHRSARATAEVTCGNNKSKIFACRQQTQPEEAPEFNRNFYYQYEHTSR